MWRPRPSEELRGARIPLEPRGINGGETHSTHTSWDFVWGGCQLSLPGCCQSHGRLGQASDPQPQAQQLLTSREPSFMVEPGTVRGMVRLRSPGSGTWRALGQRWPVGRSSHRGSVRAIGRAQPQAPVFHRQEAGVGFGMAQGPGGPPGVPSRPGPRGDPRHLQPAARLQTQSPPGRHHESPSGRLGRPQPREGPAAAGSALSHTCTGLASWGWWLPSPRGCHGHQDVARLGGEKLRLPSGPTRQDLGSSSSSRQSGTACP